MEFRRIEYFLTLAETLNFTKAASIHCITTQAFSRQIALLEEELGTHLFERTTRSVRLTEVGEEFRRRFSQVKTDFDRNMNEMKELVVKREEQIRIGFFTAVPKTTVINPVINLLLRMYSSGNIEILSGDLMTVQEWLDNGEVDLAITQICDYDQWNNYHIIKISRMPAKIAVSYNHPWASQDSVTEEDIAEGAILLAKEDHAIERNSFYGTLKCRERKYIQDFDSRLTILEMGKYFAVFPHFFQEMSLVKLKYYDLPESMQFDFYLSCLSKKTHTYTRLHQVSKLLQEELIITL